MATLRNKRKLAAVTRETQEEHPRNGQSRNTSVPRINEEHITQTFEEIEGRVTKKLSQEYSRTESRILGALSKSDKFLLNPQIRTHSRTVPGTFRNTSVENQGTNEDVSQSDLHPEAGIFRSKITQNSRPEVGHDSYITAVPAEICIFQSAKVSADTNSGRHGPIQGRKNATADLYFFFLTLFFEWQSNSTIAKASFFFLLVEGKNIHKIFVRTFRPILPNKQFLSSCRIGYGS